MTDRQRLGLGALFVVALLLGVVLGLNVLGGPGGTQPGASPSPTTVAQVTPSAGASAPPSSASAAPASASPEVSPTSEPSGSPEASASGQPSLPPGVATITLTALRLDAKDDPDGKDRVITFSSRGAGDITIASQARSSQGAARLCLSTPEKLLGCTSRTNGGLHASTTKPAEDFILTLRGVAAATPEIDVTLTFPATAPSITIDNARFDGTGSPDLNGIEALITPRADGDVRLQADWGGHPFLYEVHLMEQGGPGNQALTGGEAATRVDAAMPVTSTNPWLLTLANAEEGFGPTSLTATISWP